VRWAWYRANMNNVTDHIRLEVRLELVRQGIKQTELAKRIGLSQYHVNAILNGRRGNLLEGWQRILDGLGLELTVVPKRLDSEA
jgi:transcriptional regulator with XRE-family HTH domain